MKALMLVLCLTYLCTSVIGQRQPVPNLPVANAEDAGFNRDSLDNLVENIDNAEHRDFKGMVVIKDNQLVVEWYFNSFWRNHIHDIRSAGKSITSLLLGVAIKDGLVQNLEQDVYSFFPKEKYPSVHSDYKKVKIKHLLDMSSGLDADSDDGRTPGNVGQWIAKDEWVNYLLNIPLANTPGEKWVYADINAALIAAIIEERAGMSLRDYAKEKVFEPMGIKEIYWYANAADQTVGAGNLYLSTLDFAKLGVLVTNEGMWGGKQIVQAEYIKRLLNHKVFDLSEYSYLTDSYGMLWYKNKRMFNGKEVEYLWASGKGGNQLIVVPEENMVVALTSSAYGARYGHSRAYNYLGHIFNAME